jgi:hypothetical protein
MPKTKFVEVLIQRDAALAIPQKVPVWELPILEAVHPTVEVVSESAFEREPPEAEDEFRRLSTKYGRSENEDGSKGLPFVDAVYGQHGIGIGRLRDAIKAATVEETADAADLLGQATA